MNKNDQSALLVVALAAGAVIGALLLVKKPAPPAPGPAQTPFGYMREQAPGIAYMQQQAGGHAYMAQQAGGII